MYNEVGLATFPCLHARYVVEVGNIRYMSVAFAPKGGSWFQFWCRECPKGERGGTPLAILSLSPQGTSRGWVSFLSLAGF